MHIRDTITVEQYENLVKGKTVIVDFMADWCNPCKVLAPNLEKAANECSIELIKINIEQNHELCRHMKVTSIPNVKVYLAGSVVEQFTGNVSYPDLVKRINAAKDF
jgi:thioredoxin